MPANEEMLDVGFSTISIRNLEICIELVQVNNFKITCQITENHMPNQ